jgi:benzodiazapine receptor
MTTVSRWGSLAAFILLTLGGGTLIGTMTLPGPWYEALEKPFFNPPKWLFGPAWTVLYILVGFAGWRVWTRLGASLLMNLWLAQLIVNFLWSPTFFGMQSIGGGLVVVVAMLVLILAFIALAWNRERVSALLFLPYAAWVAFATTLNASIFFLN